MMCRTTMAALIAITSGSVCAQISVANIDCRSTTAKLIYDCEIALVDAKTRAPLSDAQFSVTADMPSMPMMHQVKSVVAVADGTPGIYRARLALEMPGIWTVKMRFSKPGKDLLQARLEFETAVAKPRPTGVASGHQP